MGRPQCIVKRLAGRGCDASCVVSAAAASCRPITAYNTTTYRYRIIAIAKRRSQCSICNMPGVQDTGGSNSNDERGTATLYAHVAQLIQRWRRRAALSQSELAERVGTTQSVISRLESEDYGGHSLSML